MTKILVETTGSFQLINGRTGDRIRFDRPTVVVSDGFTDGQLSHGTIKILIPELADEVTDEDWVEWLKASDGDIELAVSSFGSKPVEAPPSKKTKGN